MMSTEEIVRLSDEMARKAAKKKKVPYVPFDESEVNGYPPFPLPNIGSYRPDGWDLESYHTCDKTGFGLESEPALTVEAFKRLMKREIAKEGTRGFAIIEEGQFQLVVGVFRRLNGKGEAKDAV
jgi:hypothetical protein